MDGFEIKRLNNLDLFNFQKLIQLFGEVFEMEDLEEPPENYLIDLLGNPCFMAFVIIYSNEIVGGSTAYEIPMYYKQSSEAYIYDIAIKTIYQRKGLGKKLLSALKEYCREKGIGVLFVEAHEKDEQAVEFYRSTGGLAEKVVHFNYPVYLKE